MLYHATTEFALKQIQQIGFIGVTDTIMLSYIHDIFKCLKVPEAKYEKYCTRAIKDLEEYAPNGQVSFWPKRTKNKMMEYNRLLGRQLGEAFGSDLIRAVKYASRVTKTSFTENVLEIPVLAQDHVPVILEVDVPVELIVNKNNIGTSSEIYTSGVVPACYIMGIEYI